LPSTQKLEKGPIFRGDWRDIMEGSAVTTTQVLIDNNQLGKLWGKLPEIFPQ